MLLPTSLRGHQYPQNVAFHLDSSICIIFFDILSEMTLVCLLKKMFRSRFANRRFYQLLS